MREKWKKEVEPKLLRCLREQSLYFSFASPLNLCRSQQMERRDSKCLSPIVTRVDADFKCMTQTITANCSNKSSEKGTRLPSRGCWGSKQGCGVWEQEEGSGAGCQGTALWAQMSASIVGIFSSKPVVDSNTVHLFKAISNMSCLTSFKSYLTPRNSHEFTVRIKEENSQRQRNYHFHFVHRRCL